MSETDTGSSESKIEQNITSKNETSSQEVKDIKFVKSSNAFEVALEYQKQLIHQEYKMKKLEKSKEDWMAEGRKEVEEEYIKKYSQVQIENRVAIQRKFFFIGLSVGFLIWFFATVILN
jgi:hypothetical protein